MTIALITALGGAGWEAELIAGLDASAAVVIARRCVDVVELLAVAASGQARAALLSTGLRRLDVDVIDRLLAADVVPIGVLAPDDSAGAARLATLGVRHTVTTDAPVDAIVHVVRLAVEEGARSSEHAFTQPGAPLEPMSAAPGDITPLRPAERTGRVIAVWGPTGAPGRTTVAVHLADELARLTGSVLLVDADSYGGAIASVLGVLDESAGLAAACRAASSSRLDPAGLAALCWQLEDRMRVLTGIPRAERWPELRPTALAGVLSAARGLAEITVVDCGFSIEADEEISFDSVAPRRNGSTLAVLDAADVILVVGAADPIGLQRLVRALADLRDLDPSAEILVILNRVRGSAVPGRLEDELSGAVQRFAGHSPAALLPYDLDALDAALQVGRTLGNCRPSSRLRRSLATLARGLAGSGPAVSVGSTPPVFAAGHRHRRRAAR